jgi:hypothetical protein
VQGACSERRKSFVAFARSLSSRVFRRNGFNRFIGLTAVLLGSLEDVLP